MKKTAKKVLSLLLCVILCISMLPLEAFAEDDAVKEEKSSAAEAELTPEAAPEPAEETEQISVEGTFNGSPAQIDANGNLLINEENFPDDNFRSYISTNFDTDNQGYLTAEQVAGVKTISCYGKSIASLKGVEYFTALTWLYCSNNQLTALDVSKNTALATLFCQFNQLTTLDVSKNIALTELYCDENQLTELDVSQNTELINLTCYNNQIGALDVSQNAKLTVLGSAYNPLTTLDVSQNTALEILSCGDNQLTSLDVSKNTALIELSCGSNQLTTLDVSNNTVMTHLDCINNQLTTLDVSNNIELFLLDCSGNPITALDVSRNTKLVHLTCSSNKLITLHVRDLPALKRLYCDNNQLTTLDVSQNTALEYLGCDNNKLTALDVSNNTALIWLNCGSNQITALDVSRNTELTDFYCYSNHLPSLDLSQNTKMSTLDCSGQTSAASAEMQGSDCIFDLGAMVGSENLDRVTNLSGGTYDSSTGLVTLNIGDGATTAAVEYDYDHQSVVTESNMDVTVNLSLTEESADGVVASGTCGTNLTWTLDSEGTLTISGTGEMTNFYPSSAPWKGSKSSIKSVVVEDGVTSIGTYAFSGCSSLTSVTIPDSVIRIGAYAFYNCSSLSNVTIPKGVTRIYFSVFENCSSLTSVTIPGSVASIDAEAFSGCSSLTSVTIPGSVTSIGTDAFNNCSSLTAVYISDLAAWCNISFASDFANPLYYAKNLYLNDELITDLVIPEGVTSIGGSAFNNCSNLTSVTIPASVTSIGRKAFNNCSSLTAVYISDLAAWCNISFSYFFDNYSTNPLYYAKKLYLNDELITDMVIPEGVTSIGDYAFYNCSSLTSVTIPGSVTSIGEGAFIDCSSLTAVYISDLVAWCNIPFASYVANPLYYARNLYLNDELLTDLVIPGSVTSIAPYTFYNCISLKSVTIPVSVTSIGMDAFYNCSGLTAVYISDLTAWCNISFASSSANPLRCARNLYLNNELITDLVIPEGMSSVGNYVFSGCSVTSITIPDVVTSIGSHAFYNCSSLTSVTIPGSVSNMGNYAFCNCYSLTSVVIMDGATGFGSSVFNGCSGLSKVRFMGDAPAMAEDFFTGVTATAYYPEGNETWTEAVMQDYGGTITWQAVTDSGVLCFGTCGENLNWILDFEWKLTISGTGTMENYTSAGAPWRDAGIKTVVIENGVTSIGNYAFSNCSGLPNVTIPEGVTSIGSYAFHNCSSLTYVTIPASVTSIGEAAFNNCSSLTAVYIHDLTAWCNIAFSNFSANPLNWAKNLYLNNELITDLVIPESVTSIGDFAFRGCSITSVTIPEGVTNIGSYAFSTCSSLTDITIPDSVTSIGDYAFSSCTSLMDITIPDSVTCISAYTFYNCSSLTDITIPEGVTSIGDYAFTKCSGLTSITIPASMTSIGGDAFEGCSGLTDVYISDLTAWCKMIFQTSSAYPLYYGGKLYLDNELLTDLVIPRNLKGADNFRNCSSLKSVTFPVGVTGIIDYAFSGCSNLTEVRFRGKAPNIGANSFAGVTATAYYPENDETWTETVLKDYGGNLTWQGVFDANGYCGAGLAWALDSEGTLTISGTGEMYNTNSIPWKNYASSIKAVVIEDGVTGIADYAFSGCGNLTSVTISESVTSIGSVAFQDCKSLTAVYISNLASWCKISFGDLTSNPLYFAKNLYLNEELITDLVIPESVTSICDYAFYNCRSLTSVTIPEGVTSIGNSAFSGCRSLTAVYISDLAAWFNISFASANANPLSNAKNLYLNDELITDLVIPEGMSSVGNYVFSGCSLKSVTIPASVTSIGSGAFSGCSSLTGVYISDLAAWCNISFASAGANPLYCAKKLYLDGKLVSRLAIPEGVTGISSYAFCNCTGLKSLTIPASVTGISNYAFQDVKTALVFEGDAPVMEENAFSGMTATAYYPEGNETWTEETMQSYGGSITWKENVKISGTCGENLTWVLDSVGVLTISGTGAMDDYGTEGGPWYSYNADIVSVVIDSGVTRIGSYAFFECSSLTDVEIPFGVTDIGSRAFFSCTGLTSVTLPESMTSIGGSAFYNCTGLTSITIPGSVTGIGDDAFCSCSGLTGVTLSQGVTSIGSGTFSGCSRLTSITIPDSVTSIGEWAFYNCSSLTGIAIPDSVTSMDSYVFWNCTSLESVTLPECLTSISLGMFMGCKALKSVTLPAGVTSIGNSIFKDCSSLKSVTIPEGVTSISNSAFYNCTSLESVTIPESVTCFFGYAFYNCSSLKSITIPEGVKTISNNAFQKCSSLTSVTIPKKVTSIGNSAFYSCSNLKEISFEGNAPSIETNAFYGVTASAYYPAENETWTGTVMQNYGGSITWTAKIVNGTLTGTAVSWDGSGNEVICLYSGLTEEEIAADITAGAAGASYIAQCGEPEQNADGERFDVSFCFEKAELGEFTLAIYKPGYVLKTLSVTVSGDADLGAFELQLPGDISGDGTVNTMDLIRLMKYVSGESVDIAPGSGDVNGDGRENVLDLIRLMKYINGEYAENA